MTRQIVEQVQQRFPELNAQTAEAVAMKCASVAEIHDRTLSQVLDEAKAAETNDNATP